MPTSKAITIAPAPSKRTTTPETPPEAKPAPRSVETGRRTTTGVWIHYRKNDDLILVQSMHANKIDSATAALDAEIPGKIAFVPWDANLADVIK